MGREGKKEEGEGGWNDAPQLCVPEAWIQALCPLGPHCLPPISPTFFYAEEHSRASSHGNLPNVA